MSGVQRMHRTDKFFPCDLKKIANILNDQVNGSILSTYYSTKTEEIHYTLLDIVTHYIDYDDDIKYPLQDKDREMVQNYLDAISSILTYLKNEIRRLSSQSDAANSKLSIIRAIHE